MTSGPKSPLRVVVLGAPCSGKSTLASQAAKEFGLTHLAFHRLCRCEYEVKSEVGMRWRRHTLKNEAFVVGLANQIIRPYLDKNPRFVLDGFPKRTDELEYLRERYNDIDAVLLLDIPFEMLLSRVGERLQCPDCWTSFLKAARRENTCPECGARGERRQDDEEAVFRKRWEDFQHFGDAMFEGLSSFSNMACRVASVEEGVTTLRRFLKPGSGGGASSQRHGTK